MTKKMQIDKINGNGAPVLLHICCGICASSVISQLKEENYRVTGFFCNPNIHPREEYDKRLEVVQYVSKTLEIDLIVAGYDNIKWLELTDIYKNEPEGGKRCGVCFKIRLEETYKKATEMNIPFFATTLTVSPHKNAGIVNKTGLEIDSKSFLVRDFKKKDGYKKSVDFSKLHNLYHQHYCGCVYSLPVS
ncbi:MAG: epoxyqueuosine reductase QueH [Elusimicrobiota bacterium]